MANEYAVNRADLTTVADAIREKGGTTDALTFPDGFAEAIGAISAGGNEISGHPFKSGKVTFASDNYSVTIQHGFGRKPNIIRIWHDENIEKSMVAESIGIKFPDSDQYKGYGYGYNSALKVAELMSANNVVTATDTDFAVTAHTAYFFKTGREYSWMVM